MGDSLFKTSYAGSKVEVYQNRIEWRALIKKISIPINQIASVELGMPLYAQVVIETTGGKKYKIPVAPGKKAPLRDAIYSAQSGGSQQVVQQNSDADEIEKLANLREKGLITEEEFQDKKKKILG